jgi:hypothetical protein
MEYKEGASTSELRRMAAEMILEAASLTDELTDKEARPLISWCLSQGEAAAAAVATADALSAGTDPAPAPDDAREALMRRMAPVRLLMRAINDLAGKRRDMRSRQVFEELDAIRSLAQELPEPGGAAVTDVALAELAAWQTGFDNGAFVGAVLYLLQGMPIGEAVLTWWSWESGSDDVESP